LPRKRPGVRVSLPAPKLNILAAMITLIFVLGGASSLPHYIVIVIIEVAILLLIIRLSWRGDFKK
jgi:hypothetical protein